MSDFSIREMLAMQQALQEKYKDKWEPICPQAGKHKLLWMIGETGELSILLRSTETPKHWKIAICENISWKSWQTF